MSNKLCVCLYTVLVEFTIFYLILLAKVKEFPESCYFKTTDLSISIKTTTSSSSTLTTTTITSTITTTSTTTGTTTSTSTTIDTSTTTTIAISTTKSSSSTTTTTVNPPCTSDSQCPGNSILLINGNVIKTMICSNNQCVCFGDYSEMVIGPPFRCVLPVSNSVINCVDNIQCRNTCKTTGNNKCE